MLNAQRIKKLTFGCFLTGIGLIFLAIIISNLFPGLHMPSAIRLIVFIIMALPWLGFMVFLLISPREDKTEEPSDIDAKNQ